MYFVFYTAWLLKQGAKMSELMHPVKVKTKRDDDDE